MPDTKQKAILTFEDQDDDTVAIRLELDPPMPGKAKTTAAVGMAFKALELLKKFEREADDA